MATNDVERMTSRAAISTHDLAPPKPWRRFVPMWLHSIIWVDYAQKYDAFLSYSWKSDAGVAPVIQSVIQKFLCPWYKARARAVFRDLSCLPAGSSLEGELFDRLDRSTHLIVLASPEAAASHGMEVEARHWFSRPREGQVLIIITSGDSSKWEEISDHLLPPSVGKNLTTEPLFIPLQRRRDRILANPDGQQLREELVEDLNQILLRFYPPGIDWGQLRGEERLQRRRARWLVSSVILVLLMLVVVSVYSWRQAVLARNTAYSRELAAQATGQVQTDVDLSLKLALEGMRVSRTDQAEDALREALVANRVLAVMSSRRALTAISLSPDGSMLLGGDSAGTLHLWRVDTGAQVAELPGHTEEISSAEFSRDGKQALTASWDTTARIWDLLDKRSVHTLPHDKALVGSARFSPDGKFVATIDGDGILRVWDAQYGKLLHTITAHSWTKNIVFGRARVEYSPDGSRLLTSVGDQSTATGDSVARLWDTQGWTLWKELPSPAGVVTASWFSADGTRIFTGSDRGGAYVWNTATGNRLKSFDQSTALAGIYAFSPDASVVLTSDRTSGRLGNVTLVDVQTEKPRTNLYGVVTAAAFDSSSSRVATGNDRGAAVWDANTGKLLFDLRGHFGDVTALVFGKDDATLITASNDRSARVWDLHSPRELVITGRGNGSIGPVFSADGRMLVTQTSVATTAWDASTGDELASFDSGSPDRSDARFAPEGRLLVVNVRERAPRIAKVPTAAGQPTLTAVSMAEFVYAFSPDRKTVVTANPNYSVAIRDRASWAVIHTLEGHHGRLGGAVFGHDGTWLMTAAEDGSARVWETATGHLLHNFRLNNRGYDVVLSPDGRLACVVENWPTIKLWDTRTWNLVHTFVWEAPRSGGNWAKIARFSPDGTLLAVGDNRGVLHILDIAARKERATINAQKYAVDTLAFSRSGRFILTTGAGDQGARVWDVATGKKLAQLGTQFVVGAAFRPGSGQIATLGTDGTIRVFNEPRYLPLDELLQLATARVARDWTPSEREEYLHE
jgi:WD40 repeat protein